MRVLLHTLADLQNLNFTGRSDFTAINEQDYIKSKRIYWMFFVLTCLSVIRNATKSTSISCDTCPGNAERSARYEIPLLRCSKMPTVI